MFAFAPNIPVPANSPLAQESVETMKSLWQALPSMTFLLGVALGATVMYIAMTVRSRKLQQGLAKSDSAMGAAEAFDK
jgi:hypothetical protein